MKKLLTAVAMATHWHGDQMRKGSKVPYVSHPIRVAQTLAGYGFSEDVLAAAVLHDVVEDCGVRVSDILLHFGAEVAGLVNWVTDKPEWEDLPKTERKHLQAAKLANAPIAARAIKIADQMDNVRDAGYAPPPNWSLEKRLLFIENCEYVVACISNDNDLNALHDEFVLVAESSKANIALHRAMREGVSE